MSVVALSGGVGGSKLALGLYHILPPNNLTVVANVGDDFDHLGLHVSPDIDTLMYTLAGIANDESGWGRADETWSFMTALEELGGPSWFRLGDHDLATNVLRTVAMQEGMSLSDVTTKLCGALDVRAAIKPITNDAVRTLVHTEQGVLPFQRYFVEEKTIPKVNRFEFEGAKAAKLNPDVLSALEDDSLQAVVVCPSNPFISIDPMLALRELSQILRASSVPVIGVSPVVAGRAIKGPTVKMMKELGMEMSSSAVAFHYKDILDGFIIDESDPVLIQEFECPTIKAPTIMNTMAQKKRLAQIVLEFAQSIAVD